MHRQEAENDHFPAGGRRACTQGTVEREGGYRAGASEGWSSLCSLVGALPLLGSPLCCPPALMVSHAPGSLGEVRGLPKPNILL